MPGGNKLVPTDRAQAFIPIAACLALVYMVLGRSLMNRQRRAQVSGADSPLLWGWWRVP